MNCKGKHSQFEILVWIIFSWKIITLLQELTKFYMQDLCEESHLLFPFCNDPPVHAIHICVLYSYNIVVGIPSRLSWEFSALSPWRNTFPSSLDILQLLGFHTQPYITKLSPKYQSQNERPGKCRLLVRNSNSQRSEEIINCYLFVVLAGIF